MARILNVVGTRPNFVKVAPAHAAMLAAGFDARLLHTGQHYDPDLSKVFFDQLGMPRPDINLGAGSGSDAQQTARIMESFEPALKAAAPDLVLVAGDVNSTVACSLVAAKHGVPIAHLEAGLRSFDRSMPEEINRVVTDQLSQVLLTPSADADANLIREGIAEENIFRVGNIMIDSLRAHLEIARARLRATGGGDREPYGLLTLHRPSNVDDPRVLSGLLRAVAEIAVEIPIVFPMHPRTRRRCEEAGLLFDLEANGRIHVQTPLGYFEFLALEAGAELVLTDSGGLQEETTVLGIPCLTLRENTERPITVIEGTNTVVGTDEKRIIEAARSILHGEKKIGRIPELWDGKTAGRVVDVLRRVG